MDSVKLGSTGINVSPIGIGLSEIGQVKLEVSEVSSILNTAIDGGINFLDTAACYGGSEELIGKTVSHRRDEFTLATKCGHTNCLCGTIGEKCTHQSIKLQNPDWSGQTISDSIERSLKRLQTDYIDLVQLHSCDINTLENSDVIDALIKAKESGKTRFIGYSGDNDNALWAVQSGQFDTLQTSFNIVDQNARNKLLPEAASRNMGVIVKRPIANGVWARAQVPRRGFPTTYAEEYFDRAKAIASLGPLKEVDDPIKLAMGFTFAHPEVDTAIIGTTNPKHILSNISMMNEGLSISDENLNTLVKRFNELGENWNQLT